MARIKVRATKSGYLGLRFRRPGHVFDIQSEQFSKRWMEKVESKKREEPKEEPDEPEKPDESEENEGSSEEKSEATGDQKVI